jgi:hypothetical protein
MTSEPIAIHSLIAPRTQKIQVNTRRALSRVDPAIFLQRRVRRITDE